MLCTSSGSAPATSNFVFLTFSLKFIPFPTSFTLLVDCKISSSEFAISAVSSAYRKF